MTTPSLPAQHATGDTGHTADHNALVTAIGLLQDVAPVVYNVKARAFGAIGNGTADDTAPINAALSYAAQNGGGTVLFPPGHYKTTAPLVYSGSYPLLIQGSGTSGHTSAQAAGSTTIHMTFSPGSAISVSSSPFVRIQDLDIAVDGTSSGPLVAGYNGIYASGSGSVWVERCQIYKRLGNYSVTTAIQMAGSNGSVIRDCNILGEQQGIWMNGGAGCTVEDTFITTTVGAGYGAVRMDGIVGTIQLSNVVTFRGDWGFYGGGSGNEPVFVYINNCQVNNPRKGGIYMQAGSQVWVDYAWISMAATPAGNLTHGVYLDAGFEGWFYMLNSVIQSPSGYGAYLGAGKGFVFSATSFGGCGNSASNTYDDVHVAAAASNVTIDSCHLDVDRFNTINGARSAVYVESGAGDVQVTGCMGAGTAYRTAPVIDLAGTLVRGNCIGLGVPDSQTSVTPYPLTAATSTALSPAFPVYPYDAQPGTVYRLSAEGNGTQGSTVESLFGSLQAFGSNVQCLNAGSGVISAGQRFSWEAEAKVTILSAGASGTASMKMRMSWSAAAGVNGADEAVNVQVAFPVAINTTVANTIQLLGNWSSAAGSPSLTVSTASLERIQNVPLS